MGFLGANNEVAINTTQKLVATADTSQQRPPRLCSQLMIEAQCLRILPNADTLLFHRAGRFVGLVSGLCKIHWIIWMLTCLSHKIVHCMVCIVLASGQPFLPVHTKGELLNSRTLNCTSTHCHYWKYTRSLRSRDMSLLQTLQMAPMLSSLQRFQVYIS